MIVWLGAALAGVIVALLNREVWGWLPIVSRAIIWMETRLLPKQLRKLRQMEWLGELSAYDDRRLTGLVWTLQLLPVCVWTRTTDPAGNPCVRFSLLLPLAVAITAALILWPNHAPSSIFSPNIATLPRGYVATSCIYESEGPNKAAHDIQPGGRIEQEFTATQHYIWRLEVNIGINPAWAQSKTTGKIQMDLLDSSRRLLAHNNKIQIINNGVTIFGFTPVKVIPGKHYWMRLVNASDVIISPYMRSVLSSGGTNRRATGAGTALVYGEVNRDDAVRQDSLVGCIEGARRTKRPHRTARPKLSSESTAIAAVGVHIRHRAGSARSVEQV